MTMSDTTRTPTKASTVEAPCLDAVIDALSNTKIDQPAGVMLVDTVQGIESLIDAIADLPTSPPSLYIELEGINLSRHGSLSILQIHALPAEQTYLVDVHTLGASSFSTPGSKSPTTTLQSILQSPSIPKVFFDVRNDSDALHALFSVHLHGIHDLQLMELAARRARRRFVSGLAKCIEQDAPLTVRERLALVNAKEAGKKLFAPERGGSYAVFNERPMKEGIVRYCANDVCILPRLWRYYDGRIGAKWREKVLAESAACCALAQKLLFGQGTAHGGGACWMVIVFLYTGHDISSKVVNTIIVCTAYRKCHCSTQSCGSHFWLAAPT